MIIFTTLMSFFRFAVRVCHVISGRVFCGGTLRRRCVNPDHVWGVIIRILLVCCKHRSRPVELCLEFAGEIDPMCDLFRIFVGELLFCSEFRFRGLDSLAEFPDHLVFQIDSFGPAAIR